MKRIALSLALVLCLAAGLLAVELPASGAKAPHHLGARKVVVVRGRRGPRGARGLRGARGTPGTDGTDGMNGQAGPSATTAVAIGNYTLSGLTTLATLALKANTNYLVSVSLNVQSDESSFNGATTCEFVDTASGSAAGSLEPTVIIAPDTVSDLVATVFVMTGSVGTLTFSCASATSEIGRGELVETEVGTFTQP